MTDVLEIARGVVAAHEPHFADHILAGEWDTSAPVTVAVDAVKAGINAALASIATEEAESADADA